MANTYTQLYVQVVFAVQGRASLIPPAHAEELYKFITGIVTRRGQKMMAINGMPDHLHLLLGVLPDVALSDVVRDVKAGSSRFINERAWGRGRFAWQAGFGAFSYSASQIPDVARYIERQPEHHAHRTFGQEYELLLQKFGVRYEQRYLFGAIPEDDAEGTGENC